jgi:hypothetical protein
MATRQWKRGPGGARSAWIKKLFIHSEREKEVFIIIILWAISDLVTLGGGPIPCWQ